MIDTVDILIPKTPPQLSNYDILYGSPIAPIQKLAIMNDSEFEEVVLEWVHGYLKTQYVAVRKCGGAGDKGRDIIAIIDQNINAWDNYQCKHYGQKLSPTNFYLELGKLCYYSYNGDFSVPQNYYIVSQSGVGTKLGDLLDNPDNLKINLINNWDAYVRDKITKIPIPLIDDFKTYVTNFNFSIVKPIEPLDFLEQFQQTKWYSYRFGGIKKQREVLAIPNFSDAEMKLRYITQLLAVYSEEISNELNSIEELSDYKDYKVHFDIQRKSFYTVETLKQFERDNLPLESKAFENLKDDVLAIAYTIVLNKYSSALRKVNDILGLCSSMDASSNPLAISITIQDKQGVCHHLVNENKLTWIEK